MKPLALLAFVLPAVLPAQSASAKPSFSVPPTETNVPYGKHPRQVLHFWKAKSDKPTPFLFYIHGGGWTGGSPSEVNRHLRPILDAGISVVSVSYRLTSDAGRISPPVQAPMEDCARALQFVRSKSSEWNLDKARAGASGGSAGGCTSLWLAFQDDMAKPRSNDPVARESTRLWCAAVQQPQTSLDPRQMREWIPNISYGGHAFGIGGSFDAFLNSRSRISSWIRQYSPYELVSKDDSPVGLFYPSAPDLGKPAKDATHSANFGAGLKEKSDKIGHSCDLVYPGSTGSRHGSEVAFLIAHLRR
jgi:acetyl esterase/lipase